MTAQAFGLQCMAIWTQWRYLFSFPLFIRTKFLLVWFYFLVPWKIVRVCTFGKFTKYSHYFYWLLFLIVGNKDISKFSKPQNLETNGYTSPRWMLMMVYNWSCLLVYNVKHLHNLSQSNDDKTVHLTRSSWKQAHFVYGSLLFHCVRGLWFRFNKQRVIDQ